MLIRNDYVGPKSDAAERVLRRFGQNPFGENIYRAVWAPQKLIWSYEEQVPEYPNLGEQWVLEKWLSVEEDTGGMSRAEWEIKNFDVESGKSILGPYPAYGYYNFSFALGEGVPCNAQAMELVAQLIERGKLHSAAEKQLALRQREEERKQQQRQKISDVVDDVQTAAMRGAAFSGFGGHSKDKRPEDVRIDLSHEDLLRKRPGLGRRGGHQISGNRKQETGNRK